MYEMFFEQWSPNSARRFTYLAGDSGCACGYDIIADMSGDDLIKIYDEPYKSGYAEGFITWLDSDSYLYYNYPSEEIASADLILSNLDGVEFSWPVTAEEKVVEYWVP